MKRIFKKEEMLTVPNILSALRIALIPVTVWLYSVEENYYAAIWVILFSALTDVVDGWIARRFNMVSDFGKALDPIADKLTQGALLICLLSEYDLMWALTVVFTVGELMKLTLSIIVIEKHDEVNSAQWYGKANSVFIYVVMILLILLPQMQEQAANLLICACGAVMLMTHGLYLRFYLRILTDRTVSKSSP